MGFASDFVSSAMNFDKRILNTDAKILGSGGKSTAPKPLPVPTPQPAATPPTMSDAINTTQQKAKPTKQTSGGTVGDLGPEGLTTPPQTANLTLLGGTK